LPEQSRMNGRDTRFRSLPVVKQFELANTPMKTELYVGLDVHKETELSHCWLERA
jgi:hypothetical protein